MVDLHAHILPGMDDGAKDLKESIHMCRIAEEDGITTILATPHTGNGVYLADRQKIISEAALLSSNLADSNINMEILPGADVHMGTYIEIEEMLVQGKAMTVNDNNRYLMVEFPEHFIPANLFEWMFKLKLKGITPIFTHPERNLIARQNLDILFQWVEKGGLIQLTSMSLTGEFGSIVKNFSEKLVASLLVHIIASDAHSALKRPPILSRARDCASALIGPELANKLVDAFPSAVIEGKPVDIPEPARKRTGFFARFFS